MRLSLPIAAIALATVILLACGSEESDSEDANSPALTPSAQEIVDRGIALAERGSLQEAIRVFGMALELDPANPSAYYNLGVAYQQLGLLQEAIESYDLVVRLSPSFADAYDNRGSAYLELGDYAKAIENYDMSIQLRPDGALAYFNRGAVHEALGNQEQADSDRAKARELDPVIGR